MEITAEFEVTGWEQSVYDEPTTGPAMGRATVHKTFRGGLEGTSVAELLTAGGADGRGYVASERFTGTLDGKAGTVVFMHGGLDDGAAPTTFGHIVPGSGTGDLSGLTGTITYQHDENGAKVQLVIE
jgi:hypothetical protein